MEKKRKDTDRGRLDRLGSRHMARRRLLTLAAYAAPFVITSGLPKSSEACSPGGGVTTAPTPKPRRGQSTRRPASGR